MNNKHNGYTLHASGSRHQNLRAKYDIQFKQTHPLLTQYKNGIIYGGVNSLEQLTGLGLIMYDNGDILISRFQQDRPMGLYYYFDYQNCMSFYGVCNGARITEKNYVYSRKNAYLQAEFLDGKILSEEIKVKNGQQIKYISAKKNQKISYNRNYSSLKQINTPLAAQDSFIKPTDFLYQIARPKNKGRQQYFNSLKQVHQYQESNIGAQLCLFEVSKNQMYFGKLEDDKPSGLGVIFVDQWPVCYGIFENGELNGLAHVEQNPLMIIDGIFQKSNMKKGWVIDLKHEVTSFGVANVQDHKFQLVEEFLGVQYSQIKNFRAFHHKKSVIFRNNFALQMNLYARWPVQCLQQISHSNFIENITNRFSPSYISEISPVTELSSNRFEKDLVELIRQHNDQKQSYLKVSKILESRLKNYESEHKANSKNKTIRQRNSPQDKFYKRSLYFEQKDKSATKNKSKQRFKLDSLYSKYLRK